MLFFLDCLIYITRVNSYVKYCILLKLFHAKKIDKWKDTQFFFLRRLIHTTILTVDQVKFFPQIHLEVNDHLKA